MDVNEEAGQVEGATIGSTDVAEPALKKCSRPVPRTKDQIDALQARATQSTEESGEEEREEEGMGDKETANAVKNLLGAGGGALLLFIYFIFFYTIAQTG